MTFLAPTYLWLFLLLIIPLILYLLPMPRRRVKTAALYLWERFLEKEPFGKASEKIRRALGFALLAAIFICLILAAAAMALGRGAKTSQKVIVILDASASMNAVSESGGGGGPTNFARAKTAAGQLIGSLSGTNQVAVVESSEPIRTLAAMGPPRAEMQRALAAIEPFDGPAKLQQTLSQTFDMWGSDREAEVYVFTNRPLPENPWGQRAHAWIAPTVGDNVAITDLQASRKNREIVVQFTLANFGKTSRALSGTLLANNEPRGTFTNVPVDSGKTVPQLIKIDEPAEAAIEVKIDNANDALATDDSARAIVPSLDAMSVAVAWPELTTTAPTAGARKPRNEYVNAVIKALQTEGVVGPVTENLTDSPVTTYVNNMPASWPKGGAIVLYPFQAGVRKYQETLTITHQIPDPLLEDVDLRGLVVKDAVQVDIPEWAHPLVWANEIPLVWAGEKDNSKVLFIGIPVTAAGTSGSRLPLVASFPVLLRNAMQWMLPPVEILRPGQQTNGWTTRRATFATNPSTGKQHAFSVLSTEASDLRKTGGTESEMFTSRKSLAGTLVLIAIALLALEWGLFHRRLTE
ncbi:MAG: VWA domain-containing protein [Phycisphaerales bacterium]|nr:VWA domain-containing protein [Phycisphaerales bacterium]